MTFPKISIVLLCQNISESADLYLTNFREQMLSEIEVLCVDMGAADGTWACLETQTAKDARVKILHVDAGDAGVAKNLAIRSAQGDYVGFVAPGDVPDPAMYERLVQFADAHPRVDVVKCNYDALTETDGGQSLVSHKLLGKRVKDYGKMLDPRKHSYLFGLERATRAGIYRRSFLTRYNIRFREAQGNPFEEHGFWFQTMALAGGVAFLPEVLCRQRDVAADGFDDVCDIFSMCDEYDFIEQRIKNYHGILDAVRRSYLAARYRACSSVLRRLAVEKRPALVQRMHADFAPRIPQEDMVDKIFPRVMFRRLNRELKLLLADPAGYLLDINKQVERAQRRKR